MKTFFAILIATCLSFLQVGCNDSSTTNNNTTEQPGGAAPNGQEVWTQVQEQIICETSSASTCVGEYGFIVFNDGTYQVGPAPDGKSLSGKLDPADFNLIAADADAVATDSLTLPYTCTGGSYIPGIQDNVSIEFLGATSGSVIYRGYLSGLGSSCYIGNEANTLQLQEDLHNVLENYYPTPFPSLSPSPTPSSSASPSGTPLDAGEWGGTGVEMTVSSTHTSFQFNCAHGQTTGPIYLSNSGAFSTSGVYDNEAGPIIQGDPREYPAVYSGTLEGAQISLTVSYTSFLGVPVVLSFTLVQGQAGSLNSACPLS